MDRLHHYKLELIDKGILIKKTYNDLKGKKFSAYVLNDDFQRQFLDYVYSIIEKNIKPLSKYHFDIIINQVNSFPDAIRQEKILMFIENILKDLSPYVLDKETEESMVLDLFNDEDYLKFHNGNLIPLENESIKELINEKVFKNVIELLKKEYSGKPSKSKKRISYEWQGKPEKDLPELYRLMIDKYKLISLETTYEQFESVFTGQPIEDINPIKWHQDNASELLYFLLRLEETDNIIHNKKRSDYLKLAACFIKPDGKPFKVTWKSLKTDIELNLSPDKQKVINELIKQF